MSLIIPEPGPGPDRPQPYYLREHQSWAVQQENQRHDQAIYQVGEYAMFLLMWHINDFKAGRVGRCPKCYGTEDDDTRQQRISEVYDQPTIADCPECFGTTFRGGIRARIIRPAIFSDSDEDEQRGARGVTNPQAYDVESTTDFRVRTFDYVFRRNGDRMQLRVPQRVTVRTGFDMPTQASAAIGYNHARASLEDPTSVAYKIPPEEETVENMLSFGSRLPYDFARFEFANADLIPPEDP